MSEAKLKARSLKLLKKKELEKLIQTWNNERLALYHLTTPNDNLEYYGIIRIYHQDDSSNTTSSKCCRISSKTSTQEIIAMSIEKFQIKSLNSFFLIETHDNGDHKKIKPRDHPLEIQLGWCEDGREGKFFLCQANDYTRFVRNCQENSKNTNFPTILSNKTNNKLPPFMLISDSAFTRTISDRNKVIERQRQKMVNKKLIISKKNSNNNHPKSQPSIGTIKVFATSLFPEAPYKTVIVSIDDTTENVMKEALDKFALSGMVADPNECHMVVVVISNTPSTNNSSNSAHPNSHLKSFRRDTQEFPLPPNTKPLQFYYQLQPKCQTLMFHIRKTIKLESVKTEDIEKANTSIRSMTIANIKPIKPITGYHVILKLCSSSDRNIPYYIKDIPASILLEKDIAIFGSNKKLMQERLYLGQKPTKIICFPTHPSCTTILPIHCIVSTLDNVLTVVPCVMDADVRINNEKIYDKVIVHESSRLTVGNVYCYDITINHPHFYNPNNPNKYNYNSIIPNFENTITTKPPSNNVPEKEPTDKDTTMRDNNHSQKQIRTILQSLKLDKFPQLPLGHRFNLNKFKRVVESCITYADSKCCDYKLEPSFVLYMSFCSLYEHLNPIYADDQGNCHPNPTYQQFVGEVTYAIHELFHIFKKNSDDFIKLVFWLSNTSQLYHFLTNDYFLQRTIPKTLITTLEDSIREMIKNITLILQQELDYILQTLLDINNGFGLNENELDDLIYSDIDSAVHSYHNNASFLMGTFLRLSKRKPTINDIFVSLNSWISLFYYMKLNISFTVQIFQKIFNYCNEWLVAHVCNSSDLIDDAVFTPTNTSSLSTAIDYTTTTTNTICYVINSKLAYFRIWAESQGLEEAFDDQFQSSYELLHILECIGAKNTDNILDEVKFLLPAQLNSLLKFLLTNPNNPTNLINSILNQNINLINTALLCTNNNNSQILLIADDDYSSHANENITICIRNFLQPLIMDGISVLVVSSDANSNWENRFEINIFKRIKPITQTPKDPIPENKIVIFQINKPSHQSLGIHIVAVQDELPSRNNSSIFIKSIVKGLLADKSEKFNIGDQIISINDWPLSGLSVTEVVSKIKVCEPILRFKIIKSSAQSQGIMSLISDSPEDNVSRQKNSNTSVSSVGYNTTNSSSLEMASFPEPPDDLFDDEPTLHKNSNKFKSNSASIDELFHSCSNEYMPYIDQLNYNNNSSAINTSPLTTNEKKFELPTRGSLVIQHIDNNNNRGGWVCVETSPQNMVDSAFHSSSSQL